MEDFEIYIGDYIARTYDAGMYRCQDRPNLVYKKSTNQESNCEITSKWKYFCYVSLNARTFLQQIGYIVKKTCLTVNLKKITI